MIENEEDLKPPPGRSEAKALHYIRRSKMAHDFAACQNNRGVVLGLS